MIGVLTDINDNYQKTSNKNKLISWSNDRFNYEKNAECAIIKDYREIGGCMKKILLKSTTLSIVCKIYLNLQAVSVVKTNIL